MITILFFYRMDFVQGSTVVATDSSTFFAKLNCSKRCELITILDVGSEDLRGTHIEQLDDQMDRGRRGSDSRSGNVIGRAKARVRVNQIAAASSTRPLHHSRILRSRRQNGPR